MKKIIGSSFVLVCALAVASSMSFAQSDGASVYKAKCQMCHGPDGLAESPVAKAIKVKPINDPDVKKYSLDEMLADVKNGKGKMLPFKDKLTDAQIREATLYFRSLGK